MTIHIETPYIESRALSARTNKNIWLKLETVQPSGSFKTRGIGHACTVHKSRGARRFISSSGGNAGLAVAYAGRVLGIPVVVVVPKTTSDRAKELIRRENAQVEVFGESWMEANEHAIALTKNQDAFIHPFDDPLLWAGHATLIDEMSRQGPKPDAIVLSVGGGGLLCGVVEGLRRNSWQDVPVIAVETRGADSFAQALAVGHQVTLPAITSIATSLGARQVALRALELASSHPIESIVVSDAEAVDGSLFMLEEHRQVVEPACGASIAALFSESPHLLHATTVAVVVCGGVGSTVTQLQTWKQGFMGASAPIAKAK